MVKKYSTDKEHKTRAGLNWVESFCWVPGKILVGLYASQKFYADGWYGQPNLRRLEQVVGDRIPELVDAFKKDYDGPNSFGYVLARRAAYCLPSTIDNEHGKGELKRFQQPAYGSTYTAVNGVLQKGKLTFLNLQELQQNRMLLELPEEDVSGMYILWNVEDPSAVYVGISDDVRDRIRGHTNAGLYMWDLYATGSEKVAGTVEKKIHKFLEEIGEPFLANSKGRYRVKGQDARKLVNDHMNKYYDGLFHNYGGSKV